ncbi:MAG: cyclodeaminase/cyclohydrolase family protein [Acidobacteriota bacterium]|nr:cyclodeaminase/cyclohydrolase family protein [Acidobacteriota bacterium]
MSLTAKTVNDLLDAFASNAPTPGGGSAAALSGAIGASLLAMVASLPKTKTGDVKERETLDVSAASLNRLRATLTTLVDEDTRSYDLVTAAYKNPKGTDEEKAARTQSIQAGLRAATATPLETMRACDAVIREAACVAQNGNPSALSDVWVGVELAIAGLRGAERNVAINLPGLSDEAFKEEVASEAAALLTSAGEQAEICRKLLN